MDCTERSRDDARGRSHHGRGHATRCSRRRPRQADEGRLVPGHLPRHEDRSTGGGSRSRRAFAMRRISTLASASARRTFATPFDATDSCCSSLWRSRCSRSSAPPPRRPARIGCSTRTPSRSARFRLPPRPHALGSHPERARGSARHAHSGVRRDRSRARTLPHGVRNHVSTAPNYEGIPPAPR